MRNALLASILLASVTGACAAPESDADPALEAAALAMAQADSQLQAQAAMAPVIRDSAKATLASLLTDPASAVFDSVVVVQPPMIDGRWPMMVVCGRIGGRPGIGGRRTPVRFVYQNRFTVFVEESANAEQFTELWGRLCGGVEVALDAPVIRGSPNAP